ncbi:MAG: extracellular solute-binding protein [Lachnospiraceae bacterium]|nr:extracellular solute-binding protein [Lachnospiraceae bacterium]
MNVIRRSIALISLLTLFLTGCGHAAHEETNIQEEVLGKYTAQYNILTNVLAPNHKQMHLTTEAFYHVEIEGEQLALVRRALIEPEEQVERVLLFEKNVYPECFSITETGELLLVEREHILSEDGKQDYSAVSECRMKKYSDDGSLLWENTLSQEIGEPLELHVDAKGQIYLRCNDEVIHIYDAEGVKKQQMSVSQVYNIASTPDGKGYLLNGRQVREVSSETGQAENIPELERKKVYHTGQELAIIDETYLYTYHPEQDIEICKRIDLLEHYVDTSSVERMAMDEDGNIAVLCRESLESRDVELVVLSAQDMSKDEVDKQVQPMEGTGTSVVAKPKTVLQLVALVPETYARTIVEFNRSSTTATVKMMKLPGEGDLSMRIAASLLSENAPDMIQMREGAVSDDYHKYADNGYLLDLTPYLEKSEVLSKDDFADWVIEDFTVDGKIYALPTMMQLESILVPTEYTEGRTNWNIEEYLDFLEKYPNAAIEQCTDADFAQIKELYLQEILFFGIEAFVDRENGIAHMDGERFRNVLERLNNLKLTEVTGTIEERVDAGELVIDIFRGIGCNRDLANAEWIQCRGKDITLMGFPTPDATEGKSGAHLMVYFNILGITSTCEHPEEAWKFIERNLMAAINGDVKYFPTGKKALEVKFQEETAVNYDLSKEEEDSLRVIAKNRWSVGVITQEQVNKLRSGFENASWFNRGVDDALLIILEEVKPYFVGQKSLDETVKILQSRMQIYLDERY